MNGYILEAKVRRWVRELRRARVHAIAGLMAAIALAVLAAVAIAHSLDSSALDAGALALVASVGATCAAVWGGRAVRSVARFEQRIVQAVSAAADRPARTPQTT